MKKKKDLTIPSHFLGEAYGTITLRKQLLGKLWHECKWIVNLQMAAGIRKTAGHDGKTVFAVYVADEGFYQGPRGGMTSKRIMPDIEKNGLFPTKEKAIEYIESLKNKGGEAL